MVDLTHPKCPKLSPRRDGPTDVAPLQVRAISSGTSVPLLGSACTPSPECGYAERTLVKLHPIRLFTPTQPHYANCTNIFDQHINLTTTTSGTGTISWVPIPTLRPWPSVFLLLYIIIYHKLINSSIKQCIS